MDVQAQAFILVITITITITIKRAGEADWYQPCVLIDTE